MTNVEEKAYALATDVRSAMKKFDSDRESRLCVIEAYGVLKPLINEMEKGGYAREITPEEEWDMQLFGDANESIIQVQKTLGFNPDEIEDAGATDVTVDLCSLSGFITDAFIAGAEHATIYPRPKPYKK